MDASKIANTGKKHTNEHRENIAKVQRKITIDQAIEIKAFLSEGVRQIDLAVKYGVSQKGDKHGRSKESKD